jgi:hypothetical protein
MLANYIQDRQKVLHFNVPGVPIKRNDDNATREHILNMTPEQRKELGINKSTLWYIQKTLRGARRSSYTIRSRQELTVKNKREAGRGPSSTWRTTPRRSRIANGRWKPCNSAPNMPIIWGIPACINTSNNGSMISRRVKRRGKRNRSRGSLNTPEIMRHVDLNPAIMYLCYPPRSPVG